MDIQLLEWQIESSNIIFITSTKSLQNLSSSDTPYTLGFRIFGMEQWCKDYCIISSICRISSQRGSMMIWCFKCSGWNYN